MNKIGILLFVIAFTFISCGGNNSNSDDLSSMEESASKTLYFNDGAGVSYTLYLDSDKSARLTGRGNVFYGYYDNSEKNFCHITFIDPNPCLSSHNAITPRPSNIIDAIILKPLYSLVVRDGYLYFVHLMQEPSIPNTVLY